MYTPIQIEAIKLLGRNDLTEGCLVKCGHGIMEFMYADEGDYIKAFQIRHDNVHNLHTTDYEILGHIPHLEDLFRVAEEKGKIMDVRNMLYSRIELFTKDNPFPLCIQYNPIIQLLDQPNLEEIISLFK